MTSLKILVHNLPLNFLFRLCQILSSLKHKYFGYKKITAWESRYFVLFRWIFVLSTDFVQVPIYRLHRYKNAVNTFFQKKYKRNELFWSSA